MGISDLKISSVSLGRFAEKRVIILKLPSEIPGRNRASGGLLRQLERDAVLYE